MIFPRIMNLNELYKVASIELSLANLQMFTRVPALQYFQVFKVKKP